MRFKSYVMGALFCALYIALSPGSASAGGGFDRGCGVCGGGYSAGQVFFAAPTYTYAPPTITVVPHYIVQPNYIVERTYVLRPTRYVRERGACSPCGGVGYGGASYLVNQGQYLEEPALYPDPVSIGYRSYYGYPHNRYGHDRYRYYSHYRRYHAHW